MKAVRLHGRGDLRVEEVPPPGPPEPGWVRVGVTAAGICGSDLHNFRTGQWITRSPSTAGHEFTGTVLEVGAGVEGLAVGDSVVADSRFWCGACAACLEGRRHLCASLGFVGEVCDGGFADECALPAWLLHRVDAALDPRVAAMAEPLAVALHAVRRLGAPPGRPVLVVGCGTIGGLAALLLSRGHDRPILVHDRDAARAALVARCAGATPVPLERETIMAATNGSALLHTLDATGSTAALTATLACVDGGATLALVGIFHRRLDIDPNVLVEREVSMVGCHAFADELVEAIALLAPLSDRMASLVGRELGLDDVPEAYGRLAAGTAAGLKTIVRPGHAAGASRAVEGRARAGGAPSNAAPIG